ncbi:hypothetical protein ACLOJK_027182 [Asimina triloba]
MELLALVTSCFEADYTGNKPLAQLASALSAAAVVPFPALTPDLVVVPLSVPKAVDTQTMSKLTTLHRSHPVSLLIDDGCNASSAANHSPIATHPPDPRIPTLSTSSACSMALPSPSPSSLWWRLLLLLCSTTMMILLGLPRPSFLRFPRTTL